MRALLAIVAIAMVLSGLGSAALQVAGDIGPYEGQLPAFQVAGDIGPYEG